MQERAMRQIGQSRGIDGRISYARSSAASVNESPFARAHRLRFDVEFFTLSASTQGHVRRIAAKIPQPSPMGVILDRDEAPLRVCRWVAWGRWLQDRAVRLALATHMRAETDGRSASGWAWPKDHLCSPAEVVFWAGPAAAKLVELGVLSPRGVRPDQGGPKFTVQWDQTWAAIQREVSALDRAAFLREVEALAEKRARRRVRKHVRLSPAQRAYVNALDVIKRGVLHGDLTLEDASAMSAAPVVQQKGEVKRR